jgi:hypothetical protein
LDLKPLAVHLCKYFFIQQMHLSQVWPVRVFALVPDMLHRRSAMGIAFDAQARNQVDVPLRKLAEGMACACKNADYERRAQDWFLLSISGKRLRK